MGERVLVLGAGVSGKAAARLARRLGHRVTVYDAQPGVLGELDSEGFETWSGDWAPELLRSADLVVTSPGFPEHAAPVRQALESGLVVWSEVELAWRHLDRLVVAVTGTNGKTTVSALTAAMLEASDVCSVAAGNIGYALSEAVGGPWEVVVAEVSSFQLRFVQAFHPQVAVVLNVAPDHLDWHGHLGAYAAAKANIFRNQTDRDVLAFDVDDSGASRLVEGARSRLFPLSGRLRPEGGSGPEEGVLHLLGEAEIPIERLWSQDSTFLVDVAAAGTAALAAGAGPAGVEEAAGSFRPAPHRREWVAEVDGVAYVDDSKATNPHAAVASARAFPSVVLIAGGRNKDLDLSELADVASVRHVVAIGEAGPELAELAGPERSTMVGSMEEAVAVAAAIARPGDTVLLAPGCASFDMYRSYGERGEDFSAAVRRRTS